VSSKQVQLHILTLGDVGKTGALCANVGQVMAGGVEVTRYDMHGIHDKFCVFFLSASMHPWTRNNGVAFTAIILAFSASLLTRLMLQHGGK
jgi:hypothetical protein